MRSKVVEWEREITYHTYIHENVRKRFLEGFNYDAHPMGMLVSAIAALSTYYKDAKVLDDPETSPQVVRLIAKMPTLAAAAHRFSVGMPFVYPDNSLGYTENFLSMMWKVAEPRYEADPISLAPSTSCSSCTPTTSRTAARPRCASSASSHGTRTRHRRRRGRPLRSTTRRRQRSGAEDAEQDRQIENIPAFIETVKAGKTSSKDSVTGSTRTSTRAPRSSRRPPTTSSRSPARTHCSNRAETRRDRARGRLLHLAAPLSERRLLLGSDLPGDGLPRRDVHGSLRHPCVRRDGCPTSRSCSSRT